MGPVLFGLGVRKGQALGYEVKAERERDNPTLDTRQDSSAFAHPSELRLTKRVQLVAREKQQEQELNQGNKQKIYSSFRFARSPILIK